MEQDELRKILGTGLIVTVVVIALLAYAYKDGLIEAVKTLYPLFIIILLVLLCYLVYYGSKQRLGRNCCVQKCHKPLRSYGDTFYCLRWNSGRKPTALFFCGKHAKMIYKKKYKGNFERGEEDKKGQHELLGELKEALK